MSLGRTKDNSDKSSKRDYHGSLLNGLSALIQNSRIEATSFLIKRLLWGLSGKESTCDAEEAGHLGLILGLEDPLEKGLATHSSMLAWRIPWTEEPRWSCDSFPNQNYSLCDIKAKILELTFKSSLPFAPTSNLISSAQFSKNIQNLTTSHHLYVTLLCWATIISYLANLRATDKSC